MPYVDRDDSGTIVRTCARPQRPGHEYVEETHRDVTTFRARALPGEERAARRAAVLDALVERETKSLT